MAQRRVLVVDDDDLCRENYCHILQRAGYEAIACGSGEDALQGARTRIPHVITLDVVMPGLDGFAVLSMLKQEPQLQSVPVLMMTSSRSPADVRRARDLGASTYLAKPVDAKSFLQRVGLLLPAAQTNPGDSLWPASTSRVEWLD